MTMHQRTRRIPLRRLSAGGVALWVLATVSSTDLVIAQTAPGPAEPNDRAKSGWVGQLTWKHRVERPDAWAETEGKADLRLDADGSGGLAGTIVGSHSATSGDHCPGRTVAPGGFQAKVGGAHTPATPGIPGQDAMTLQASETQTTPMQMEISCPFAPPVVSHHSGFYEIYEKPLGALRPTGDGRFRSDAEQTAPGEAGSTMTTTYAMTLRARDCPDDMPARGLVHYMGGGVYAEPSYSSPVIGQPPLGMRVVYEERATMIGGEIWFRVRVPGMQGTPGCPAVRWLAHARRPCHLPVQFASCPATFRSPSRIRRWIAIRTGTPTSIHGPSF
jgi:hypothetical protein